MDYTVYIPSKGRKGLSLNTLNQILHHSDIKPIIVCPKEETENFQNQYNPNLVQTVNKKYLGQVWQHILENCPTQGIIIIDDDLRFCVRYLKIHDFLEQIKDKELNDMFVWMNQQLNAGFVHGSISIRKGNHFIEEDFRDCTNAKDCLFFNRDVLLQENARLDRLKTMQDFDITLQLMSKGYPNRVGYNWCCDQLDPTAEGGTTLYRTPEIQKEAAYQLAEFWPEYVKVIQKKAKNKSAIYGNERYDVRIAWRRCWKNRNKNHKQLIQVPEPIL